MVDRAAAAKAPSNTPSTMTLAVGLVRCSTDTQEHSTADQEAEIRAWAKATGHTLLQVFGDEGVSGSQLDRPGIRALLTFLEGSDAKGTVVCWKRNRLARPSDPRDGLVLERRIEQTGWRLHFLQGARASGNALVDTLMGVIEHHEGGEFLRGLAVDVVRGRLRRLLAGELAPSGPVPYGYAKELEYPDGSTKRFARGIKVRSDGCRRAYFVPGEAGEVEVVQGIFECYATGKVGLAQLASELNDEGLVSPRGKRWLGSTVRWVVQNPVYVGEMVWNRHCLAKFVKIEGGKAVRLDASPPRSGPRAWRNDPSEWIRIKDHHEPIVSRELFERANRILEERGKQQGGQRVVRARYPLSGILFCGRCGYAMGGRSASRRGRRYRRYMCTGHLRAKLCECYLISAEKLELAVLGKLRDAYCSHGLTPAKLHEQILRVLRQIPRSRRRGGRKRASFEREDRELAAKIQQAIKNMGVVSQTVAQAIGQQVESWAARRAEIEDALTQIAEEGPPAFDPEEAAESVTGLLTRIEDLAEDATPDERRDLLHSTVERVELEFQTKLPPKGRRNKKHTFMGGDVTLRPLFPDGSGLFLANSTLPGPV